MNYKNDKNNKQDNDATGEVFSWIIILILMAAFWPVGVALLLKKLSQYAKKQQNNFTHGERKEHMPATAPIEKNQLYQGPAAQQKSRKESARKKKKGRSPLERKSGASVLLLLCSIVLFIVGGSTLASAVGDLLEVGTSALPDLAMGSFYLAGGFISMIARNVGLRKISRYKTYNALIGERLIIPLSDIVVAAGVPEKNVRRDIQAMIDAGYLGSEAYIDNGLDSVVLSSAAADNARRTAHRVAAEKAAAEQHRGDKQSNAAPENRYMAIILELRSLNETILDIPISDKIDQIEILTAKIFRIVEENPAKLPQIRRFMNYYLPTTLKLLHSYAVLEKQNIKGENITGAKESINQILDKLAKGYEQQLDLLFKDDAIDISADIDVLESMMKQDGLTGSGGDFQTMQTGGGS